MDFNYYIYQHLQQVYSSLWTSSPSGASSRTCVRNTENRGRQLQRGSQNHWLGFGKFRKHTKSALHATTGRGPSSLSGPPGMFHIYTQPWLLLWHTLFLFLRRWNRPRRKCKWSGRSGERWATLMRACFKKLLFSRLYLVKQGMKSWDASLREQAGALLLCVCVRKLPHCKGPSYWSFKCDRFWGSQTSPIYVAVPRRHQTCGHMLSRCIAFFFWTFHMQGCCQVARQWDKTPLDRFDPLPLTNFFDMNSVWNPYNQCW